MVQIIEQDAGPFGRIGKGLGQGLSEQLPKSMDQMLLSQGLKRLEQDSSSLTPLQQYIRAASIPGISPAVLQALPEVLKNQGVREAFKRRSANGPRDKQSFTQSLKDVNYANLGQGRGEVGKDVPARNDMVRPEEIGQPQVVNTNPLRQEALPRKPWTQDRILDEVAKNMEEFPGLTLPEAQAMAKEAEARELAQPEGEQKLDEYLKTQQKEIHDKFMNQLGTKLQKTNEGVFEDINGEMLINLQRALEKDIRMNPRASVDDMVNKWTRKALDLAKAKKQALALSKSSIFEFMNKEGYRNKLKDYSDIFSKAGNSEEFFNILKSDFNMSPQGSASIAYPRNKNMQNYISKIKPQKINDFANYPQNSMKYADDIGNLITPEDSILAIARDLMERDPYFDQTAFFKQLSEDKDRLGLNERQRREIAEGAQVLPSWGDILILPIFRGLD